MNSNREELEKASLGVIPNPLKLAMGLLRPAQPFVMINTIAFKGRATEDYAHLTGQEAYELYAQSVQKAQAPLGSRMLWSGKVAEKMTAGPAPNFQAIAFLEYASPKAFLQANLKGKSNTIARKAGLKGQWLIASTTLIEDKLPDFDEEHMVLIEFSGGMKRNLETAKRWHEIRQSTYQGVGAKIIWHGRCDHHILGTAKPQIEDVLVTWFPNPRALEKVVHDSQRKEHLQSVRPYLTYTASSVDLLPELR